MVGELDEAGRAHAGGRQRIGEALRRPEAGEGEESPPGERLRAQAAA